MTDSQRRRLSFGIILTVLGLVAGNLGLQGAMRTTAFTPGAAALGILVGAVMLAVGIYLLARFSVLRRRNR